MKKTRKMLIILSIQWRGAIGHREIFAVDKDKLSHISRLLKENETKLYLSKAINFNSIMCT